jgi:hypothetical protein
MYVCTCIWVPDIVELTLKVLNPQKKTVYALQIVHNCKFSTLFYKWSPWAHIPAQLVAAVFAGRSKMWFAKTQHWWHSSIHSYVLSKWTDGLNYFHSQLPWHGIQIVVKIKKGQHPICPTYSIASTQILVGESSQRKREGEGEGQRERKRFVATHQRRQNMRAKLLLRSFFQIMKSWLIRL